MTTPLDLPIFASLGAPLNPVLIHNNRLDPDLIPIVAVLENQLDLAVPKVDQYDRYYEGEQRLSQLGLAIPPELRRFIVITNWPRIAVDGVEERLERRGFQMPGQSVADSSLWDLWLYNEMDQLGPMGDRDALKIGRSYRIIGANDEDAEYPLISVESPREVTVIRDPRTRKVRYALKRYNIWNGTARSATYYDANQTIWLDGSNGGWEVVDRNDHNLGVVPVVPVVNRPKVGLPIDNRPLGTSEMDDIIPICDAAARNLTNAQVAQETHAIPQRVVTGATASDFIDPDTNKMLPVWETYFGAVWAMTNPEAKASQFQASDMANFERMQDLYARQAAALAAMPPNYFGLKADDAASADAIRSREARLNRKCERRILTFTGQDKMTMRIALRIRDGDWDPDAAKMLGLWHDPGTPTLAQRADATVKLVVAKVIPVEQARKDLGYSPEEMAEMALMDEREAKLAAMRTPPQLVGMTQPGAAIQADVQPNVGANASKTEQLAITSGPGH